MTRRTRRLASSSLAIAGGVALVVGALLPWMSFFVGLRPLRGTTGLNGYVFLVLGVLVIAGGIAALSSARTGIRQPIGIAGVAATVFATWLLIRLLMAVDHIAHHDPMMLVRIGPGLFVVWLGAALTAASLGPDFGRRREEAARPR